MNSRTLTALRGSIEKWEEIVDGSGTDGGTSDCPLCMEFNTEDNKCKGCPVKESTGWSFCRGTPFQEWSYLIGQRDDYNKPRGLNSLSGELREEAKKVAQEEVDFLKSLLPPPHSQELAKMVVELDKANSPDEGYRGLLSTLSKEPLRRGETWRMRVLFVIGSQMVREQTN